MSHGKIVAFALLAGALAVGGTAIARTADSGLDLAGFRLAAQGESGEHGRRDRDEARERDVRVHARREVEHGGAGRRGRPRSIH